MTARRRTNASAWLLCAPFAAVFVVFVVYPLLLSLRLSTQQTFGAAAHADVGLRNFAAVLTDRQFHIAARNTLWYTAGSLFVQLPLALGLALLLNRQRMRGRAIYRLVLFSPQMFGLVFAGILAQVFLAKEGVLNQIADWAWRSCIAPLWDAVGPGPAPALDLLTFPWLGDHPVPAMILVSLWMYVGFNMIFFLAALQNVDRQLAESAMLDGAGPWNRFRHVTVPAILPVGTFVVLLSVIGSMQLFELPYITLAAQGAGDLGLFLVPYLFEKGFASGDLGYASAIGWLLALMLIAAALVQRLVARGAEA